MNISDENLKYVNDSLNELKVNTQTIVIKMEQMYDSIEKLEKSIKSINEVVGTQEKRITVIEQSVPKDLIADLALLKNSQEIMSKVIWIVSGGTLAAVIQSIFKIIN
jgi:hypothetical protein